MTIAYWGHRTKRKISYVKESKPLFGLGFKLLVASWSVRRRRKTCQIGVGFGFF